MKTRPFPTRPTPLALLLAATALPLSPAFAQDAPPVTPTVSAPAAAAPAPAAQAPTFAPSAPVVQATPPRPEIEAAVAAATAERPRTAAPRATAPRTAAARPAAPVRAVAQPAVIPAGETVTEADSVPENIIPVPAAPVADDAAQAPAEPVAVDSQPAATDGGTSWIAIVGGLLIAGAIAAFLLSRRRRRAETDVYYAPTDAEGAPVAEVNLNERPWIRLALQPKPAETANDQKVEYELTVENEGRVPAHDVRVSSFMLAGADSTPEEASLIDDGRNTRRIDVQPGETVRLAGSFDVRDFMDPKLIADARYALPDGGEGHLAAKFGIDLSDPDRPAHVEDVLERV